VIIGERTGAATAYVGMTRGRQANIAHLVAGDLTAARDRWIAVFGRDRADLGPARAAEKAQQEAERYGQRHPAIVRADPPGWSRADAEPSMGPVMAEPTVRRPRPEEHQRPGVPVANRRSVQR
jgi:hypothetical protein